jgi:hypothetical protein
MSQLFSKPKTTAMPAVQPPPQIPQSQGDSGAAAMSMRRQSGFSKTLLAGELTPATAKKTLLGD